MARRAPDGAPARVVAGVLVGVLTVLVVVLVLLAYRHANPTPTAAPAPSSSTTLGVITPSPTPTPTPTEDPVEPVDLAAQRFLFVGGDGSVWRATAGNCADGVAPMLERSVDGGATFTDITPSYLGIRQIASLETFATTEAEMVAVMGDSCETQALRTFTAGEFWESYPDVLVASTYIEPSDPSRVITPDGAVDAPCDQAWGLRSSGGRVALICEGAAYQHDGEQWAALAAPGVPVAVAIDGDAVRIASTRTEGCAGLAITRSGEDLGCADVATDGSVAIAMNSGRMLVWAGDDLANVG